MADVIMQYIPQYPNFIRIGDKCYRYKERAATAGNGQSWDNVTPFNNEHRCWNCCPNSTEALTAEVIASLSATISPVLGAVDMSGCDTGDASPNQAAFHDSIPLNTSNYNPVYRKDYGSNDTRYHWAGKTITSVRLTFAGDFNRWGIAISGVNGTLFEGTHCGTSPKGVYTRTNGCCLVTSIVVN